jgi:hypothetical protein
MEHLAYHFGAIRAAARGTVELIVNLLGKNNFIASTELDRKLRFYSKAVVGGRTLE